MPFVHIQAKLNLIKVVHRTIYTLNFEAESPYLYCTVLHVMLQTIGQGRAWIIELLLSAHCRQRDQRIESDSPKSRDDTRVRRHETPPYEVTFKRVLELGSVSQRRIATNRSCLLRVFHRAAVDGKDES